MRTFYDRFNELSDESLLQRISRKEHYEKEAVLAAFHILSQRGYNLENPFPEEDVSYSNHNTNTNKSTFLEREYHVWHKIVSKKKSAGLLILYFLLFIPFLWYSNSYLKETNLYRKIHLATQTIISHGSITYLTEIILVFVFFINSTNSWNKFLNVRPKHVFIAIKVFVFSVFIMSFWEWLFSNRVTVTLITENKSPRELLSNFWYGGLVAFTEELIFKWLLLTQLLLRVGDSKGNRRLIFLIVAILFAVSHIPIQINEYGGISAIHLLETFLFSYFTSILYVKHRNFPLVVLLHFFMNISIVFIDVDNNFYFNWATVLLGLYCIPKINNGWLFRSSFKAKIPRWAFGSLSLLITSAVLVSPKTPNDHYNYSMQYYLMDSYTKAMNFINKAISVDRSNAVFLNHRGNIYYSLDKYDSAWSNYNMSVQLDSNFYDAVENRGVAAKQISKYNECIEDLTVSVMNGIQTSRVYQIRGSCYIGIGEAELAISDFEQALKMNPSNDQAYCGLGRAYLKLRKFNEASDNLEKAISLDQDFVEAYEVLALAYTGLKRYDSSNAAMTKAIEIGSKSPVRFYVRGLNYYNKKDYYNAIKEFEKSIEFNPERPELFLYLAYSYFSLEDFIKGCEYLHKSALLGNELAIDDLKLYCEKSR